MLDSEATMLTLSSDSFASAPLQYVHTIVTGAMRRGLRRSAHPQSVDHNEYPLSRQREDLQPFVAPEHDSVAIRRLRNASRIISTNRFVRSTGRVTNHSVNILRSQLVVARLCQEDTALPLLGPNSQSGPKVAAASTEQLRTRTSEHKAHPVSRSSKYRGSS